VRIVAQKIEVRAPLLQVVGKVLMERRTSGPALLDHAKTSPPTQLQTKAHCQAQELGARSSNPDAAVHGEAERKPDENDDKQ